MLAPCGGWMSRFAALAQPHRGQVRITGIKAMMLRGHSNTLIKVETDAGLTGYGEAGTNGAFARARIDLLKPLLAGQDPLAIERLFHQMTVETHPYLANIPTVSGIDIALWDLAGKITGLPVSRLMGGPFRDQIRLYINSAPKDMLDAQACRDWAAEMKSSPHKWTGIKIDIMRAAGKPVAQETPMLTSAELSRVEKGFANARGALGSEIDLMVHCHNEFDLASSIGIARGRAHAAYVARRSASRSMVGELAGIAARRARSHPDG